jgi:hypothetical protein
MRKLSMKISDRCLSLLCLKKLCRHDGEGKMGAGRERAGVEKENS